MAELMVGGDGSSSAGTAPALAPVPLDGNDDRCWWRYRIANLEKGLRVIFICPVLLVLFASFTPFPLGTAGERMEWTTRSLALSPLLPLRRLSRKGLFCRVRVRKKYCGNSL